MKLKLGLIMCALLISTQSAFACGDMAYVYATHWCGWCKKLERFMRANNLPHMIIYVDDDKLMAKSLRTLQGDEGVPFTLIVSPQQTTQVSGYQPEKIAELLCRDYIPPND